MNSYYCEKTITLDSKENDHNYYCLPHYNDVNGTQYTYDEVLVDAMWCEKCKLKTLCVIGFGHEENPMVERHKDDIQFIYELSERHNRKKRLHLKKRPYLYFK